ncbi:hypothetical protein D4764_04G0015660 [Takifugu flavidus]|uniref:Uncharacterized protein n=1 Tax=Takifugu flavidus TaxID=433684 RepID=A0A5C6N7Q5_9TELE|nr:hypothetical protein D4764_04G0015660 [Takifugu flavidus]
MKATDSGSTRVDWTGLDGFDPSGVFSSPPVLSLSNATQGCDSRCRMSDRLLMSLSLSLSLHSSVLLQQHPIFCSLKQKQQKSHCHDHKHSNSHEQIRSLLQPHEKEESSASPPPQPRLAQLLTHYLQYREGLYRQNHGGATGSPVSPIVASLQYTGRRLKPEPDILHRNRPKPLVQICGRHLGQDSNKRTEGVLNHTDDYVTFIWPS